MAQQGAGNTALGTAIYRMIEQYQPDEKRLFEDPIAKALVGAPIGFLMQFAFMRNFTEKQTDKLTKGVYGVQVCRTRYIDDAVKAALGRGIEQLVILGAGFDTRPIRLSGMERVKVFEIDLPATQEDKKKRLRKLLGQLPQNVTFVPIDFDTQGLKEVLSATSYDASRLVVFIWEGVTQYITDEAARRVFSFVGGASPGSILIFTYVLKSVIERRSGIGGADKMLDYMVKQNAPWIFGLEPDGVQDFLKPYHLDIVEQVGHEDYQERYLKPMGRDLAVFEGERIVQAVVMG